MITPERAREQADFLETGPTTEDDAILAKMLRDLAQQVEDLQAENRVNKEFAELWYRVMDEAPLKFESIVTGCSPKIWMSEAAKLKAMK